MTKYIFSLILGLLFVSNVFGQNREIIDQVIAKVGSEIILLSDIEEQYALMQAQQGISDPNARCLILDQLLAQRLMLNQARLDSLVVTDEEVQAQLDARIERILSFMNNDVSQFEDYYGQTVNEVREQFRGDLEDQITVERMQGQIMSTVSVTPSEVKDFFSSIPVDSLPYFNSEVNSVKLFTSQRSIKKKKQKQKKSYWKYVNVLSKEKNPLKNWPLSSPMILVQVEQEAI